MTGLTVYSKDWQYKWLWDLQVEGNEEAGWRVDLKD
jgi:hypothetical protein